MALLSDAELLQLFAETCYDLGLYSLLKDDTQDHDTKAALEARDRMQGELLRRLGGAEREAVPVKKVRDAEEVGARDVLMALIPAIWRATERGATRSRAAAFALVCRMNQTLRPLGYEYLMRPGNMIVLRKSKKRWTWADETR